MRFAKALSLAILLAPSAALAAPGVRSFTPTSVVMPILAVQLRADDGQVQPVYVCAAAHPEECRVDIADEAALASLFTGSTTIDEGTYVGLSVITCGAAGRFDLEVQGAAEIGEDVWYTTGNPELVSRDPSVAGHVATSISGCSLEVPFHEPLLVTGGADVNLSAFVVLDDLAWIGLKGPAEPGCATDPAAGTRVCVTYPHLVPFAGKGSPALRRYHITEDAEGDPLAAKAGGQLLLLLDDGGRPFGGLPRPLFLPGTVDGHVRYDTPLKRVAENLDGSYLLLNYGSSSDPKDMSNFGVKFPAFSVGTHSGKMESANGGWFEYLAVAR